MALSPHKMPCTELVEQWISLLACWTDSFFARQSKLALLSHLRRYLDFIMLRIGLHKGSVHIARLLTLCAFAIAYANQGQTFTVDSLASFASAFDWQAYSMFLDSINKPFSQDPNFRRFAIQHRWQTSPVARRTQAFSAVASFHSRATTMPSS